MRARADARVVAVSPIGEVVPALAAGHGVVRHLVGQQAEAACLLGCRLVERGGCVLVRQRDFATAMQGLELRPRLDRELVQRQMVGGQRQCLAQFHPPRFERLARACADHVERDAREDRPRRLQCGDRLRRRMLPPEQAQRRRIEALHADRDAVHAGLAKRREPFCLDAGGVRFEGDLDVVRRVEQAARVLDQRGHGLRLHQAGRAAAEEDRGQLAAAEPLRLPGQLSAQRGAEAGLGDALPHVGVEVAVRALGQAERPVDIEGQRFHCGEI